MPTESLRAELHCHSCYSKDSNLTLEKIIDACKRRDISVIALTDHNQVEGAERLKEMAPEWLTVIIGEEIATADGDLIGLFLKKRIEPRLPITETIRQIHAQGGLAMVPHPFDRLRHEAMGGVVLEKIKDQIDFVEVFNARCVYQADNEAARTFVEANHLHGYVCSDSHWSSEYGNANCLIGPFNNASEFAQQLRGAKFDTQRANMLVHVGTRIVKIMKARRAKHPHHS
jgi:predicted metal-dependent phosphoesterase TrpH